MVCGMLTERVLFDSSRLPHIDELPVGIYRIPIPRKSTQRTFKENLRLLAMSILIGHSLERPIKIILYAPDV
jgi:hypothetical protein